MSYLLDFYRTFDGEQLAQFKMLDLKGKEELVRDEYVRYASGKNFNEQAIPAKFQLTQKHFDKIVSVLLDKSIVRFYNNDFRTAIPALFRKGLTPLVIHELKIIERNLQKSAVKQEQIAFLKIAFETLAAMYHPNFDSKLTHSYGKKYLIALGNKATIDDKVYTSLLIHQGDMIAQCFAGNENSYRSTALALLQQWEKTLKKVKSPFALFYFNFISASYVKFFGTEVKPFTDALEKALHYLKQCDAHQQEVYTFKALCELGFGHIEGGNYLAALQSYTSAFSQLKDAALVGYYQKSCYFNACLLVGDLPLAQEVFEQYLKGYLSKGVNRSLQFDVLVNAFTLCLHTSDDKGSYAYLQQLKAYKKSEITRTAQLIIRVCENLYFYCTKDFAQSKAIALRNVKFMARPENKNEQYAYYKGFYDCIYQYSKQRLSGKPISKELLTQRQTLHGGMYAIFHSLL
ncbi:MAG: hypothetical protein U0T32_12435 [Chitinophagales bacterium]